MYELTVEELLQKYESDWFRLAAKNFVYFNSNVQFFYLLIDIYELIVFFFCHSKKKQQNKQIFYFACIDIGCVYV